MGALLDCRERVLAHDALDEAGPIHAPNISNAPPCAPARHRRSVDGQIAALGVPSHAQGPTHVAPCLLEVVQSESLGGYNRVGHGKVLVPPGERVVRAPVGHERAAVSQAYAQGGELLDGLLVQMFHVAKQLGVLEAPRCRHALEHLGREWRNDASGCAARRIAGVLLGEPSRRGGHVHGPSLAGCWHYPVEV